MIDVQTSLCILIKMMHAHYDRKVILLLDDEYVQSSEELREMVRETNRMVVDQEEVLSDHIYHYDREKDEIRIAK